MNITIIGRGNVGSALARGFEKAGHSVSLVGNEPAQVAQLASQGDVIVLAVPFVSLDEVAATIGNAADGKIVLDVTNALTPEFTLAVGYNTSGAEELQKKLPGAHVVKAFNAVFAGHMDSGQVKGEQLTAFVASDNADAKTTALELARAIGFDALDAGGLANARLLEPLGFLNIQLGYMLGLGTDIGFKLVR